MRIPPHYQQPSWQRFFAGAAIGAVISWGVFLFIFGVIQEEHSTIINKQKQTIQDLENDKKIYQDEYTKLNKKAQEKLTVQEIKIKLTNGDRYLFKDFRITNIENSVKEDLKDVMAKDIESIVSNHLLIERIIENKPLKFDGKEYKLEMTKFMLTTTLYIEIKISFVD
ncbi:sporulation membrane protein YtrI [Metabacillus endolithicus]|uniref:Sporulation membrane protein YtrI n=1 Tax=Metabacillus endolithicus TaxID=1535204 RepID=A0ABW5BYD8_9BACI|nr:sporulation membrane protein YtrI [Metabacillus endolithicus]UPG64796.1 sporulation protein [Metabacillus endolithicus]